MARPPEILVALAAQHAELAGLVDGLDAAGLDRPSRCPGWSVADVLLHLAQTDEMAMASLAGELEAFGARATAGLDVGENVDDLAGALVAAQRTDPVAARDRWSAGAVALDEAFAVTDLGTRVQWVVGELAARTLATTRLAEAWIHSVDVAVGLDVELVPTDRLWHVARLVWRTVPYALGSAGQAPAGDVRFLLAAPDGSQWDFGPAGAPTTITGPAVDLCTVAGQRAVAADTSLRGDGPDAEAVLRRMRTFA